MSWQDALKPAAIITPDGEKYGFEYEDVQHTSTNKTSTFSFTDNPLPLLLNFGLGSFKQDLKIFISGDAYDETAKKLDTSLGLPGNCILEHPVYGVRVVVVESWSRSDQLVSGSNQAVYSLNITETLADEEIKQPEEVAEIIIIAAVEMGEIAKDAGYNVDKPSWLAAAKARIKAALNKYRQTMNKILNKAAQIKAEIETIIATIEGLLDDLGSFIVAVFAAISYLIKLPGRIFMRVSDKINAYKDLIAGFFVDEDATDAKNQRIENQIFSSSCAIGIADSYLFAAESSADNARITDDVVTMVEEGTGFVTRSDATDAAKDTLDIIENIRLDNDIQERNSDNNILGDRYLASYEINKLLFGVGKGVAGVLLQLAFNLKQQRSIILSNEINPLVLCYELYKTTKANTFDFFVSTNDFIEDEFFMLAKGRRILYYV